MMIPTMGSAPKGNLGSRKGIRPDEPECLFSRREMLFKGATALAVLPIVVHFPGSAKGLEAILTRYPRKKIGSLKRLVTDKPVIFNYPDDGAQSLSLLIKLGARAGGGVGKDQDVVAFNATCTHQGGPLVASYKAETKTLGACPFHLTTFDLTRHGIVVSGQAYQSLPQVALDVVGNDIYAVGITGLLFGRFDNIKG